MQYNFSVFYLLVSVVASLWICTYAWRHQQSRGAKQFAIACFMSVLWTIGDIIGRISVTFAGEWTGEVIRYFGGCFLPVALFVFINEYCGRAISRRWIFTFNLIPLVSWVVMMTNPWHHIFFAATSLGGEYTLKTQYGPYILLVHLPYCYLISFVGFARVLIEFSRASRHYRIQIAILFFSLCVPYTINIISNLKLFGDFSYTPLSFPIFFSIVAIAIFRFRFLASNPIAYETVFRTIRDGVLILDQNNIVIDINRAAARNLRKTPKEIIGSHLEEVAAPWKGSLGKYIDAPDLNDEIEVEIFGRKRYIAISITPLKNRQGTLDGRIFTFSDITVRKQYEFSLKLLAFHDPLTQLANRHKFQEAVEARLADPDQANEPFAILYFDLNRFKTVNDTLGHEAGDQLLKCVAARASSVLRKPDMLARLGGDEFAALLCNCDAASIDAVVERILNNVMRPFRIGEHTLVAELSIGAAFYPTDGLTLSKLLHHADSAMYRAKQKGGGLALIDREIKISLDLNREEAAA